ncbi:hypothetical protein [Patulibacter minatonensis]|uniref:hypothetical protein n=1 Tax=Patulibacter minatonensis TaxID=298163 RepID=UPI000566C46C|nr:hypothetical protein [Patulibacter minatonensis]
MRIVKPSPTVLAAAALVVSTLALLFTMSGIGSAKDAPVRRPSTPSTKPQPYGILRLGANRKFPAKAIPTVGKAKTASKLGDLAAKDVTTTCPNDTIDLGTWCILSGAQPVDTEDVGKNDYFYATQKCVELGGWLPSAEELIGAADQVKLASTLDDNSTTASTDILPDDGLGDRREMSSTLVTTTAGSSAAGSEGSTAGATGDPGAGESDPIPLPADPAPDSLQYVTVFDNHDKGGFAGSKPVSSPERFRCAFAKKQGQNARED